MTTLSARRRQQPSKSLMWWVAVVLWATVGLVLIAAVIKQQRLSSSVVAVEHATPAAPAAQTNSSQPSQQKTAARSQGDIAVAAVLHESDAAPKTTADASSGQRWSDRGPTSDFQSPTQGWGLHPATCPTDTFLVYGARTEPRKYEYVVCSTPEGLLLYHGIDVESGAEIRLDACLDDRGVYRALASADYRYEVADMRPVAQASADEPSNPAGSSTITLYRTSTEIDWQYGVASEWGMQNLPTEFTKC